MIHQQAVQDFLNREMQSFAWLKRKSREQLIQAFEEIAPPWTEVDGLWDHQLAMLLLGLHNPEFLFFCDLGTGKTRVILELINLRKLSGERNRWLICVPNKANIENWLMEIEKYASNLNVMTIEETVATKRIRRESDILIAHYPGLAALASSLQPVPNTNKRQRLINPETLQFLQRKFTGIVLDESTAVGNHSSLTSRVCYQIARHMNYRYALTGTPFGRDPMPLWHQFKVIDGGETLGETLGIFRGAFFTTHVNFWGGWEYKFRKRMTKQLSRMVEHRSITYKTEECQSLPERVHIKKIVILPMAMDRYYKHELTQLRKSKGNFRVIKASFIRMRQLASGFLGLKDDVTGAKAEIEFPENPKIDELMQIIDEIPSDAKMIIFHEYIWTGNRIAAELKARKISHERLHGEQKDPRAALRRFQDDPSCRFLINNNNSGSFGLNLQVAHYEVFVETPIRPIIRQQAEGRTRRSGQKSDRVFIIDLIARSSETGHSIDDRILTWLEKGQSLLDDVLKGGDV